MKHQGQCGSCWAFAATGALEAAVSIKSGFSAEDLQFSEQYLVDCDRSNFGNWGCYGGWPSTALGFVTWEGIATTPDYPYSGSEDGVCKRWAPRSRVGIDHLEMSDGSETNLRIMVWQAPSAVCLDASEFALYESGVINKPDCYKQTNHCVLAVGNDVDAGYWILKNSWGSNWGEAGYVRVAMGSNMCGIADYGLRAVVKL